MKRKILAIAMSLAVLATMALPMSAWAADSDATTSEIFGELGNTAILTVPTDIDLTNLNVGINDGSASAGNVEANTAGWTLTVSASDSGYMYNGSTTLTAGMGFSITDGSGYGNIGAYQTAFQAINPLAANGYSGVGNFSIPLHVRQVVDASDVVGVYSIKLTFIATPAVE
jgi:hypothetical protein